MNNKIVLIDFDKTICPNGNIDDPPSIHCLNVLNKLKSAGHIIKIYSDRAFNVTHPKQIARFNEMLDYIKKYKIPYDIMEIQKEPIRFIIDDCCMGIKKDPLGNVDWRRIEELLTK